jgi:hypothetical protein
LKIRPGSVGWQYRNIVNNSALKLEIQTLKIIYWIALILCASPNWDGIYEEVVARILLLLKSCFPVVNLRCFATKDLTFDKLLEIFRVFNDTFDLTN